jgi:hypothetical protein
MQIWIENFLFSDLTSLKFVPNGFPLTLRVLVVNAPPQLTTEFFQSAPESVAIECHNSPHFPLFCHTLQYELIKYPHFTHASWHWMMYSLSIFWNKKTHVLNCQTKIYLIWPNFSCKNFPSKVSIKFANKKKQSLSLLLVVCGQHCHF